MTDIKWCFNLPRVKSPRWRMGKMVFWGWYSSIEEKVANLLFSKLWLRLTTEWSVRKYYNNWEDSNDKILIMLLLLLNRKWIYLSESPKYCHLNPPQMLSFGKNLISQIKIIAIKLYSKFTDRYQMMFQFTSRQITSLTDGEDGLLRLILFHWRVSEITLFWRLRNVMTIEYEE